MTESKRKLKRKENKRKKLAALYEVAKLNDNDKQSRVQKNSEKQSVINSEVAMASSVATSLNQHNSQRKRLNNTTLNDSNPPKDVDIKKPKVSGEEFVKMKEELRERKKKLKSMPRLNLKMVGENARFDLNQFGDRVPIFLSDVQHLLLYSILGCHSPYSPARWCTLEKFNRLTQTMVLVVEGISSYHFLSYESMFPTIKNLLQFKLELMTPAVCGGSIIEELAAVPLTGTQYEKIIEQFGSLEYALQNSNDLVKRLKTIFPLRTPTKSDGSTYSAEEMTQLPTTDKYPRTQLLLSPAQMVEENFPLPLKGVLSRKYKHYVFTKDEYLEATPQSPMFAIDCEMCRTTTGELELTRMSLINEKMETIYDTLVKPDNKIVDYLTPYSGITPEKLKDVTTKLEDVQIQLREVLPADAILVGHSLCSDLHALQMMHPYVIDTSVIFNTTGIRQRKGKLKEFSKRFLQEGIQNHDDGHCSVEDSSACMKLVQLKLTKTIDFGDGVLYERQRIETLHLKKTIAAGVQEQVGTSLFKHVANEKSTVAIIGSNQVVNEYSKFLKSSKLCVANGDNCTTKNNVRLEIQESNKSAIKRTTEISPEHQFNICHLRLEEDKLAEEKIEKTMRSVDKWVKKIWENSTPMSMICVVFGGQANAATGACFMNVKKNETRKPTETNACSSDTSDV